MELDIRHLRTICTVAEMGSLTRAAARLGLSQPALTNQLQRVEDIVGGPLFVRGRTGVHPTALGNQVIERARIVLSEVDALFGDLRTGAAKADVLRVGCIHLSCVGSIVERVGSALPGREVTLRIDPSSLRLAELLGHGRLDAALLGILEGFDIRLSAPITTRTLLPRLPIFVSLSEHHPLTCQDEVQLADLADEDWVGPPGPDDGSLAALRAACRSAGFEPRVRHEAPSGAAGPLVASGRAVRLVEPSAPPQAGTVVRPLAGEPQIARLVVAWRRDHLSAEEGSAIYHGFAGAYVAHVSDNPVFRRWWDAHPEVHPTI